MNVNDSSIIMLKDPISVEAVGLKSIIGKPADIKKVLADKEKYDFSQKFDVPKEDSWNEQPAVT